MDVWQHHTPFTLLLGESRACGSNITKCFILTPEWIQNMKTTESFWMKYIVRYFIALRQIRTKQIAQLKRWILHYFTAHKFLWSALFADVPFSPPSEWDKFIEINIVNVSHNRAASIPSLTLPLINIAGSRAKRVHGCWRHFSNAFPGKKKSNFWFKCYSNLFSMGKTVLFGLMALCPTGDTIMLM